MFSRNFRGEKSLMRVFKNTGHLPAVILLIQREMVSRLVSQ